MKIEDIKNLLEEIGLDEDGYGYIDCDTATEFTDNNQYGRIVAALKQNIELQKTNTELTKKLEEVEEQEKRKSLDVEKLKEIIRNSSKKIEIFMDELCIFLNGIKDIKYPLRIEDYLFKKLNDEVVYLYDPLKEPEPIELKIKITENSDKKVECPLCGNPVGKYPAISREDNKTKICSNCGTLEALKAFKESLKDDEVNEKDI